MTNTIGPLLSSVSLLLAAFGFVYNTQKDRIDGIASATGRPANADALSTAHKAAKSARTTAVYLAAIALGMWILLLDEIEDKIDAAFDHNLALSAYSTPDAVFFVAANVWLLIFLYLAGRIRKINARVKHVAPTQAAPKQ